MGIPALPSSLTADSFHFKVPEGHHLVYNQRTDVFSFAVKGVNLERDCTRDLQVIAERISILRNHVENIYHTLSTKAQVYYAANIDQLNPLFEKYNQAIDRSCWLTFLDYLIWFITFGHRRVVCKTFDSPDYPTDYKAVFDTYLSDPKLKGFYGNKNSHLRRGMFDTDLLQLTPDHKKRLIDFAKHSYLYDTPVDKLIDLLEIAIEQEATKEKDEKEAAGKDDSTISNAKFIDNVFDALRYTFRNESYNNPFFTARVSNTGRISSPDAVRFFSILDKWNETNDPRFKKYLAEFDDKTLLKMFKSPELAHRGNLAIAIIINANGRNSKELSQAVTKFIEDGLTAYSSAYLEMVYRLKQKGYNAFKGDSNITYLLLKNPQLPTKPDLAQEVIECTIEHELKTESEAKSHYMSSALHTLVGSGFDFEKAWKKLPPQLRITFHNFLQQNRQHFECLSLSTLVHTLSSKHFQILTKDEKLGFFSTLPHCEVSLRPNNSDEIFFAYMEHLTATQGHAKHRSEVATILTTVKKMGKLHPERMLTFINFCSGMDFGVLNGLGRSLSDQLPVSDMIEFLGAEEQLKLRYQVDKNVWRERVTISQPNIEHATNNSKLAIQLCVAQAFAGLEKYRKQITLIISNVKICHFPKQIFDELFLNEDSGIKQLHPLREILFKTGASESDSISEEQLEAIYRAQEKKLVVNWDHLKEEINAKQAIPPLLEPPKGEPDPTYDELAKMISEINFTKPKAPHFVDPKQLNEADRKLDVEGWRRGIQNFISKVKNLATCTDLPSQKEDPEGYAIAVNDLDYALKQAILKLRDAPAVNRAKFLISLAKAGAKCNGKVVSIATDLYSQVMGAPFPTYDVLARMYNEINFTRPTEPNYIDPKQLNEADRKLDVEGWRRGIQNFVSKVTNLARCRDLPDQKEDPEGYAIAVNDINYALKLTILKLQDASAVTRAKHLIRLAKAGAKCDGQVVSVATDIYSQVVGTPFPSYDELARMFNEINFTKPSEPYYVDPDHLQDDDRRFSFENAQKGIHYFIGKVKSPATCSGIPNRKDDPQGYKVAVRDLDLALKHTILKLQVTQPNIRAMHLIWLAGAGFHCGGKAVSNANDLYSQVTGTLYDSKNETVLGALLFFLKGGRVGIFKNKVNKNTQETHSYIAAMKHCALPFGISEGLSFQYNDPYNSLDKTFCTDQARKKLISDCKADYHATFMINTIVRAFNGMPGTPPAIKQTFRELALNPWFKEKIKDKNYLEKVYTPGMNPIIRRKWIVKLLVDHKMLTLPSKLNPFNWSFFSKPYWEQ